MDPFPEEVVRFIEANIESVDHLEILRLLAADREKEWSCAALARAVQTKPQAIAAHLDVLARRRLLIVTRGLGLRCRYGLGTPELENTVSRLLQLYNERPVSLIRMIYERKRCQDCAAEQPESRRSP